MAGSVETDTGAVILGNSSGDTAVRVELGDLEGLTVATLAFDVTVAGGPAVTLSAQGSVSGDGFDAILTDDPDTEVADDPTLTELGGVIGGPGAPELSLTSPVDGERIAAPTAIIASASAEGGSAIGSWSVSLYPAGGDADDGATIASGAGELPASLGTFDPTTLENGAWTLRVEVTDMLGRVNAAEASAVVDGAMKLGSYDLGFVDASWQSSLTAVSLLRSYSTLRRGQVGDFGYGWRLSMLDFVVQRNGPLGDGGWTQASCGDGFIYVPVCTTSTSPHLVTVRWPDGHVEAWDLEPEEGSSYFAMLTRASFAPRPGTTSTLEPADGAAVTGEIEKDGFVFERTPKGVVPTCREHPAMDLKDAIYAVYRSHDEPLAPSLWEADVAIARWDLELPRPKKADAYYALEWGLVIPLAARKSFPSGVELDLERVYLLVELEVTAPTAMRPSWRGTAMRLLPHLLSGLHSFEAEELREWLKGAAPQVLETIVGGLTGPAPMGPAKMTRNLGGKINDLSHRSDRVTAARVSVVEGERWHVKAAVYVAKKRVEQ